MKDWPRGAARRWYGALLLAVLGGAAVALAWAVPAAIAGGEDFARKIFLGQHTGRMVDSFQHRRPFWWYVPLAFAMLFPWLWWIAVWRRGIVVRSVWREEGTRFCLCVIAPAFIVFSAISGKQPHYMLPLVAAACLVIGRLLTVPEGSERRLERLPAVLPILACGLVLLVAPLFTDRILAARPGLLLPGWLLALVAACGLGLMACSIVALRIGSTHRAVAMLAALPIGLLVALHAGMLSLRPTFDVGPVAAFLARAEAAGTPVALLGDYEGQYHFAGRLKRQIPDVNHTTALSWAAAHPDGLLITSPRTVPDDATPAFTTPYRGRRIAIWHARDVIARGGALLNR